MDLNEFFGPNAIVVDLKAGDRWEAIDELIDHLAVHHRIKPDDKAALADAVKKGERSMSTGIGFGIAIPHASTNLVSEVVGIIGCSHSGVNFDSLDAKPVRLVLLYLVPQVQSQKHVNALVDITKLLRKIPLDERE